MHCPCCQKPMVTFEFDAVEVDHCMRCRGTWLDAGELGLLMGSAENVQALLADFSPATTAEAPRPCPICDRRMDKVTRDGLLLDECGVGHGLWLDKGELNRLLHLGTLCDDGRVPHLVEEIFAGLLTE